MGGCRASLITAGAVVYPVMFTTNQNIKTIYLYDTSPIQLDSASHPRRKQLNGLDVSPCCPVLCPIVAHSVVNTTGQTTVRRGLYKPRTGHTGRTGGCVNHALAILTSLALIYSTHQLLVVWIIVVHFDLCSYYIAIPR